MSDGGNIVEVEASSPSYRQSQLKATMNVVMVGIALFLLLIQVIGRASIVETFLSDLVKDGVIRYMGLGSQYLTFTFASLFISPVINRLGAIHSMSIGAVSFLFFEVNNLFKTIDHNYRSASFRVQIVYYFATNVLAGVGAALLFPAMGSYVTQNSVKETIERNSSIVWGPSQSATIFAGFLLFFICTQTDSTKDHFSDGTRFWTTMCLTCSVLLSITVFLLLRNKPETTGNDASSQSTTNFKKELGHTFRLMTTKRMSLLALVFINTGLLQAFWICILPTVISNTQVISNKPLVEGAFSLVALGVGQIGGGTV